MKTKDRLAELEDRIAKLEEIIEFLLVEDEDEFESEDSENE